MACGSEPGSASGRVLDELFEQQAGEPLAVVTHHAMLIEQVIEDAAQAHALQLAQIGADRLSAIGPVASRHSRRNRLVVNHHPVRQPGSRPAGS